MHLGTVAFVSDEIIRISEELMSPLTLTTGSTAFGVYYPPREDDNRYQDSKIRHDLMLTPIPFSAWPYCAGVRLFVSHKAGSMKKVSEYFKNHGINIHMSHSTRSGYLYASWVLVVEFLDLHNKIDPANPAAGDLLAGQLNEHTEEFKEDIKTVCGNALYVVEDLHYWNSSVSAWPQKGLSYFHKYILDHPNRKFTTECITRDTMKIMDSRALIQGDSLSEKLPTLAFASLDTYSSNIRVGLLEKNDISKFRHVSIHYTLNKNEQTPSTCGLMDSIIEKVSPYWDIWQGDEQTKTNTKKMDSGIVRLIIESEQPIADEVHSDDSLKIEFENVKRSFRGLSIGQVDIHSISPRRVFVSIRNKDVFNRRDEIMQICYEESLGIGILTENVISVDQHHEAVTPNVFQSIKRCNGVLQFYMGNDGDKRDMGWLDAEYFLASALEIPSIRIIDPDLESEIRFNKDIGHFKIRENAAHEDFRDIIRKALDELDKLMLERNN